MTPKAQKEILSYDGNEIYELKEEYIPESVKATYKVGTKNTKLNVTEVGNRYISIEIPDDLELGSSLTISYKITSVQVRRYDSDRLLELERKVEAQQKLIEEMEKALRNRVSVKTFNSWLKSLENVLGVEVIQQKFQTPYPL